MCPYHRFTTFCHLKTKLDKCKSECSVIAMTIFCYHVCVTYCFFYLSKPKAKNCVIVLKFMIQRLFEKSCQNLKHASSWVREESLELYTYFYPQFPLVNNKTVSPLMFANITFRVERRKDQRLRLQGNLSPNLFLEYYLRDILSVISKQQLNKKITTLTKQHSMTRFWQICYQYGFLGTWEAKRDSCIRRLMEEALKERSRSMMDIYMYPMWIITQKGIQRQMKEKTGKWMKIILTNDS